MAKPSRPMLYEFLGFSTQGDLGPYTFYTSSRGALVFFQRSPPLSPASPAQRRRRNLWALIAAAWRAMPAADQRRWERASKAAHTALTGCNLYWYWRTTADASAISTIERQSSITLLPA